MYTLKIFFYQKKKKIHLVKLKKYKKKKYKNKVVKGGWAAPPACQEAAAELLRERPAGLPARDVCV